MSTLYEIGEELRAAMESIEQTLEENGGEWTPEMAEALDAVQLAFDEKVERIALYWEEITESANGIAAQEDRLAARRSRLQKRAKWLKDEYLLPRLIAAGRDVVRPLATVKRFVNPPAVTYSGSVDALPPELVRVTPETREIDKKAALALHKAGQALPVGVSVTRSISVRIS